VLSDVTVTKNPKKAARMVEDVARGNARPTPKPVAQILDTPTTKAEKDAATGPIAEPKRITTKSLDA
jgi:hypothetical protein